MFLQTLQFGQPIPAKGISPEGFVLIVVDLPLALVELLAKSLYVAIFPADVEQLKDAPLLFRQTGQSFLNLGGLPLDYRKVCRERIPAGYCVYQIIFPAAATALYWCSIAGSGPNAVHLLIVAAAVFLVTSGIAMLISAIRGVPMINTGTIQVPSMGELQAQTGRGYARGTRSATPGWRWVGENGPELMHFAGGEAVYTAEQSRALMSAQGGGTTFVDNSQNIFKVDDIETYVAIKRMLENEKMTVRMGLARR